MNYKIYKQFISNDEFDPQWAKREIWVAVLPDGVDTENIFDTLAKAEKDISDKDKLNKEKDINGDDKLDKFGKKIKDRKYKIVEIT